MTDRIAGESAWTIRGMALDIPSPVEDTGAPLGAIGEEPGCVQSPSTALGERKNLTLDGVQEGSRTRSAIWREARPVKRTRAERRRYTRKALRGQVSGRIKLTHSVSPLDLSLGGAQIEHSEIVRPGTTMFLTLFFPNQQVTLKCTVARSRVHGTVTQDDGGRELIYRTGLEFLSTSEDVRRVIGTYISTSMDEEEESGGLSEIWEGLSGLPYLAVDTSGSSSGM